MGIKGVCYQIGGFVIMGIFLIYLLVYSVEYTIYLRGQMVFSYI